MGATIPIKQVSGLQTALDGAVSAPTTLDKGRSSAVTSGDGSTTGLAITTTPAFDSYVQVVVNGIGYELGDGSKLKDCYFSGDSGSTARNIADIIATDVLYWNGVVVEFDLDATFEVDFLYETAQGTVVEPLPTDTFVSTTPFSLVVTADVNHAYYYVDSTTGVRVGNLPAISSATRGKRFDVKLDAGANPLTITPNGGDTIDGAASLVISTVKVSYTLRCPSAGTDWKLH